MSGIALGLAFASGTVLLVLRAIHSLRPDVLQWNFKSAIPLILIGVAFACLQFAMSRTRMQRLLGLMVALAFVLWDTEQFLSNQAIVSFIDDVVVCLFVLDLGLVTYGHLKPCTPPVGENLSFDAGDS